MLKGDRSPPCRFWKLTIWATQIIHKNCFKTPNVLTYDEYQWRHQWILVIPAILDAILDFFYDVTYWQLWKWIDWIPWPTKPMSRHQIYLLVMNRREVINDFSICLIAGFFVTWTICEECMDNYRIKDSSICRKWHHRRFTYLNVVVLPIPLNNYPSVLEMQSDLNGRYSMMLC